MSDIVERLRAGTAGLTLYEIEALWGEAATALSSMDAKPSVAAQNDVLYQLSRITENDIPLDMWEIRSIVKAAIQEMARLRRLERSTEALKSWEAEKRKTTGDRFFIDHGQIHDRATGKHVTTDEDSVFCDGINSALELLNTLNAAATEAADAIATLRDENERMREHLHKAVLSEEIVMRMAGFTDPRNVSSTDDELELFASLIDEAKAIHGDLYEGDDDPRALEEQKP